MFNKMMKNKRAQEEMVGFVLIVVVVAVVFLIFLGITIRRDIGSVTSESSEVYQFLESAMEYTTNCAASSDFDYFTLGELFEECYSGNNCINEENSCIILNTTLVNILRNSWNVGPDSSIKGYEFLSIYVINASNEGNQIISIKEGDCSGPIRGASYLTPAFPGKIESSLRLCS